MRTIEEILAEQQAIIDAAAGRDLTADEVTRYEELEGELRSAQASAQVRARHEAYTAPAGGVVVPAAPDNGLDTAFEAYLRTGHPNQDISDLRAAQGEGTGAGGGYTVPSGFRQKLVDVRKSFGGFAAAVDTFSTGDGQPIEYPSLDDTSNEGTITAESAAAAGGADLTFGTVKLGAHKYTSSGANDSPLRVSVDLVQDSAFNIGDLVARKLGMRIARKQAAHWVTGTGVGQPKGIVAASLTSDRDLDTADTPDYEDLVDLQDLLDEEYDGNASWLMKRNTWSQMRLIVDSTGRPLIQSSTEGIASRPARMLLDRPVIVDEGMPTLSSAADTYCIAYGDFREAYVIRRIASLVVVVNPYTRSQYGEVEYTAWERADGNVQNRSAYKIMQNNT